MIVSLLAALTLQAATAPDNAPITTSLRPAQAIERIVANCMERGHAVEEATTTIVKCRQNDESSLKMARAWAGLRHLRNRAANPNAASYIATYNVAPRSGGSMMTVSMSLDVPMVGGSSIERMDEANPGARRALAALFAQ